MQAKSGRLLNGLLKPLLPVLMGERLGEEATSVSGPLLPFVLRYSLDDSEAAVQCAAIDGLHALLVHDTDEVSVCLLFSAVVCCCLLCFTDSLHSFLFDRAFLRHFGTDTLLVLGIARSDKFLVLMRNTASNESH